MHEIGTNAAQCCHIPLAVFPAKREPAKLNPANQGMREQAVPDRDATALIQQGKTPQ